MTYFGFLIQFLGLPILILAGLNLYDWRRGRAVRPEWRGWPARLVILGHIAVALIYTTPWDNYLVATGVWWYNPALVTGIVLGWVPIEEYTFFVLQPLLTGLWLLLLARRLGAPGPVPDRPRLRWGGLLVLVLVWLGALLPLLLAWPPGTYLGLILVWALPPIMLQVGFGGDILWGYRRLVLAALLPAVLYLCLADAVAISAGTWTIDPAQSLQIYLGGVLPLEEFIFFLVTNVLIVLGVTLVLARASQERARVLLNRRWPRGRMAGSKTTG